MKNLLILATIGFLTTSCGVVEKLDKNCGSDIDEACSFFFGTKNDEQDQSVKNLNNKNIEQDKKIVDIENRIKDLEIKVENNYMDIQGSYNSLEGLLHIYTSDMQAQVNDLQSQINSQYLSLTSSLLNLSNEIISTQTQITTLHGNVTNLNTSLSTLNATVNTLNGQLSNAISMVIDPCEDTPNILDEVVLKTRSGDFLAYFEKDGKRFLAKLADGEYITTDGTNCRFIISGQNLTISTLPPRGVTRDEAMSTLN